MGNIELIKKTFEAGDGIFRLNPVFVPRPFGKAGQRLRLHPDDYYALGTKRGSMKERWLASTITCSNGPLAQEDEGLSYVAVSHESDERFTLKEAVETLKEQLIGSKLQEKYGEWPMYSKFFDYLNPLFHHIHHMFDAAAKVGKQGKPEAYFYPKQLNNYHGDFPHTFFGLNPETTHEQVKDCIRNYEKADTKITEFSRSYRLKLGTGWYVPPGVLHAPGSLLTYEPQWNSDVYSVWENVVAGEVMDRNLLVEECPKDKQEDVEYIFSLLDWEKNIDPEFRQKYFRPPVPAVSEKEYKEDWITYGNEYVGAKELTIYPGQKAVVRDDAAYGIVFVQGYGEFGVHKCSAATMLRFGQQSDDEFFVSEGSAKKGVTIINHSKTEPLVGLKHFGPNHPDMP
ncbi:MAG: hypothetical protein FWC13_02610 [Oscillospiraceae bacterium]|nr:hypothetical protein [Oscillospiraceae bacterium]